MYISTSSLIFVYIFIIFDTLNCKNILGIDIDHIKIEEQCGQLPKISSGRIANAKESSRHYPWVVRTARLNVYFAKDKHIECGGSIITSNVALTAAHCICGSIDIEDFLPSNDPSILPRLECKGGKGKVKDPNNLPNEITDENELWVGAGSKDIQNPKRFRIAYAFVYNEFDQNANNGEYTDLGLLKLPYIVQRPDDKIRFYARKDLLGYFDIGPICLPIEDVSLDKLEIEMVGWGLIYGEYHPDGNLDKDPKQFSHSCTTTGYGPELHSHCDVDHLKSQNWECNMDKSSVETFIPMDGVLLLARSRISDGVSVIPLAK